jgi:hypothetical protein
VGVDWQTAATLTHRFDVAALKKDPVAVVFGPAEADTTPASDGLRTSAASGLKTGTMEGSLSRIR